MSGLTDEAKRELQEAIRIVREDKVFAWLHKHHSGQGNEPQTPPANAPQTPPANAPQTPQNEPQTPPQTSAPNGPTPPPQTPQTPQEPEVRKVGLWPVGNAGDD